MTSYSGSGEEESFGIESDKNNITAYIDYIKIRPSKKEDVLGILEANNITSFKFFKSESITHAHMSKWGLSDGIIAQLRDNVSKYERHLKNKD